MRSRQSWPQPRAVPSPSPGYTDAIGSEAFNLDLSRRRAAAVGDFLAPTSPGVRFVVVGKGEADPVAPNELQGKDNPDCRRLNRRVTVSIGP